MKRGKPPLRKDPPKLSPQITTGTLRVHPKGFGFLQPDEKERFPVDIFIPKHLTLGAVDGDLVEVAISPIVPEKGPEGHVTAILRRGRSHVAGTIIEKLKGGGGFAYIPLLGPSERMHILPPKDRELQVGDRLVIKVDWKPSHQDSVGEMSAYIGHISDPSCDIKAAVEEFGFEEEFPLKVLEEVRTFGSQVTSQEVSGREDLRKLECFTIDPETAKDFDDALSLTKDSQGHYHLGVHIADVSHYVKVSTALDQEARRRCNSTYFPGYVIPMLPHELSSHLCSLKPNVNRLTASILMTLDQEGTLLNYRITRSVIRSSKRFSYEEAKEVLDGKRKSAHHKTLLLMVELALLFKQKRSERGSIDFSLPDVQLVIDENGVPQKLQVVHYDITHQLVEEFMLKANEIVATHLSKEKSPLAYRIHDTPSEENIKDFALLAHSFGFQLPEKPSAEELQGLFDDAKGTSYEKFLATAFIKRMKLAQYSVENIGHYGLGLSHYTHFTSPIRRYIDLIVHRALFKDGDMGHHLEDIALECSDKERLSAKAENSVLQLKKLRLLDMAKKSNPHQIYEGIITAIKPFGIVFEVIEFLTEGFIPISEIGDDFFVFDKSERCLEGSHYHEAFYAGDTLQVSLHHVNLILQEVKWKLALENSARSQAKKSSKRKKTRKKR